MAKKQVFSETMFWKTYDVIYHILTIWGITAKILTQQLMNLMLQKAIFTPVKKTGERKHFYMQKNLKVDTYSDTLNYKYAETLVNTTFQQAVRIPSSLQKNYMLIHLP